MEECGRRKYSTAQGPMEPFYHVLVSWDMVPREKRTRGKDNGSQESCQWREKDRGHSRRRAQEAMRAGVGIECRDEDSRQAARSRIDPYGGYKTR